jgi:transcriptional antiterminator RfaH
MPPPYWAVVQSEPNREAVAARFLQVNNYSIYLPRLRLVRSRGGRKVATTAPLFPGYLFCRITNGWWRARWSPGVTRLLTAGDAPMPVPDALIASIRARERGGLVELPKPPGLKPGDPVKILQGPLQGLCGLYQGQRGHERVLVLMSILGQQRVELAREAIEAVS